MSNTMPLRIDTTLVEAAKTAGERQHRTATQQVTHWARLGRELEASRSLSHSAVADVLAGRQSYDELTAPEDQAIVRAAWTERIEDLRVNLNLADTFAAQGRRTWVVLDDDGNVVRRGPGAE